MTVRSVPQHDEMRSKEIAMGHVEQVMLTNILQLAPDVQVTAPRTLIQLVETIIHASAAEKRNAQLAARLTQLTLKIRVSDSIRLKFIEFDSN
jgi:hypothetical protein